MDIVLMPLFEKFDPENVFTIGEFALFFRVTPHKTFECRNNCVDGKFSKERITACIGANKSGTEKLPLLVVGKYNQMQSFKKFKSLPAKYQSEPSAWMTATIFNEYLQLLNKKFQSENRSVLVVVESNSVHSSAVSSNFSNIQLLVQPPNSLSPLRLGIFSNLKHFYRKEIINKEANAESAESMSILEAMTLLAESWEKVSNHVIKKSFIKAGWIQDSFEVSGGDSEEGFEMTALFKVSLKLLKLDLNSYLQFVTFDDHVAISATLSEDEICKVVTEETESTDKVKRKALSVSDKLEIIERKKTGLESSAKLCKEFGICKSVLSRIMHSEALLRERLEKNPNLISHKSIKQMKEPKLEKALLDWIMAEGTVGNLSITRVREKALKLAAELGCEDFKASDGWWRNFKARNGLAKMKQEKPAADIEFLEVNVDPLGM
jgi:transposase-like protein